MFQLSCSLSFRFQALYNYAPRNEDELELKEGDIVDVMEKCDDGWFVGEFVRAYFHYFTAGLERKELAINYVCSNTFLQ